MPKKSIEDRKRSAIAILAMHKGLNKPPPDEEDVMVIWLNAVEHIPAGALEAAVSPVVQELEFFSIKELCRIVREGDLIVLHTPRPKQSNRPPMTPEEHAEWRKQMDINEGINWDDDDA